MIPEQQPIQSLNLAPKITSVLNWKSPRDNIQLLVWYLYFPQAIEHYIDWLNNLPFSPTHDASIQNNLTGQFSKSRLITQFFWQTALLGTLLLLSINVCYWLLVNNIGSGTVTLSRFFAGSIVGLIFFFLIVILGFSIKNLIIPFIHHAIYLGIISSFISIPLIHDLIFRTHISQSLFIGLLIGVITGTAILILLKYSTNTEKRNISYGSFGVLFILIFGLLVRYYMPAAGSAADSILTALYWSIITFFVACATLVFIVLRPDDWLLGWVVCSQEPDDDGSWNIPHVTRIPFARLMQEFEEELERDWAQGISNLTILLKFSYQKPPLIQVVRKRLADTPDKQIIDHVLVLFENQTCRNDILEYAPNTSIPFVKTIPTAPASTLFFGNRTKKKGRLKKNRERRGLLLDRKPLTIELATDTPQRAIIAGLWYLMQKYPGKAKEAFEKQDLRKRDFGDSGKELCQLADTLERIVEGPNIIPTAPFKLSVPSNNVKFKEAWNALSSIQEFIRCSWVVQHCRGLRKHIIRRVATGILAKIIADLEQIVANQDFRPGEQILLEQSMEWYNLLGKYSAPNISPQKRVENPYIFAEPLHNADIFVGRQTIIDDLKNAWTQGNLRPVLLYGQTQIGKTSVIFNQKTLNSGRIILIYVNLEHLDIRASQSHLLMAICAEIEIQTNVQSPSREAIFRDPNHTFYTYVKRVCEMGLEQSLVIVLDEFEHIESLIIQSGTKDHILRFLWEFSQAQSQLGFVFVTKKTPNEIREQFDNPFTTGLEPIHVSYISRENTKKLLRDPHEDFLPYCLDEAIEEVFHQSAGHPYIVQLWAYCLMDNYNRDLSNNRLCDPLFTVDDINEIRFNPDPTFERGLDRYCRNIWDEISLNDRGSEKILFKLAQAPDGLRVEDSEPWTELIEHDVVERVQDGKIKIKIPLFQEWIINNISIVTPFANQFAQ